jgi:hypothetical protein
MNKCTKDNPEAKKSRTFLFGLMIVYAVFYGSFFSIGPTITSLRLISSSGSGTGLSFFLAVNVSTCSFQRLSGS